MFVYVGRTFTASKTGTAVREVHCEKCGCDYRYRLFRRGQGTGSSPYYLNNRGAQRRAEAGAAKQLQKLLVYGVDPVACPDCGWIQAEMVTELQRRTYRWALPVAISIGIVTALAGFIYWMSATHDFRRDLTQSDTMVLAGFAVVLVAGVVGPLVLRRMLRARTNPNRNYPQRPDPIPGAPKPFRPGEEGVLDALPIDAATADGGLAYQRQPPEVEPGGWITVQIALWPVPRVCCSCLREADRIKNFTATGQLKLPVRLCPACTRTYRKKWAMWAIAGTILCAAAGYACTLTMRRVDPEVPWILAVVGGIIGLILGAVFASNLAPPARFSRFNGPLNTIRIRFRNPNYTAVFMDEPPPTAPTVRTPMESIVPPPAARSWNV